MKRNQPKRHYQVTKATDKPTLQAAWAGIPELELSPDSSEDMPTLIDKKHCGKEYRVKDGEIYTVKLGLHSHPEGLGAFTRDSIGVCSIPTTVDKRHVLVALFAQREIYPAVFMDYVGLNADIPFRLELLHDSAALECNSGSQRLALSDKAISLEEDMLIISQDELKDQLPDYYTYTYDYITFQVRVVFKEGFEAW